jgi:hypothetical protein
MRSVAFVLLTPLLACTATAQPVGQLIPDGQMPGDGGGVMPSPFHLDKIPSVDVSPGDDITYCYYFQNDNAVELTIRRWASHMTAGVHDMILYLTTNAQQTAGMSPTVCDYVAQAGGPAWAYAAQTSDATQTSDAQLTLPDNDGSGNPVGQLIRARQAGFLQIHYLNTGSTKLHASVELNAYAYPDGTQVTFAAPFTTFYVNISIMPGSPAQPGTGMVNGSCSLPLDPTGKPLRFFGMTSHTYKQGVHTFVKDGVDTVLDNTDWANPKTFSWPVSPFYTFKSGTLFYQCEYSNPTDRTIKTGDDPATDELCMTTGYFFPARTDGIYRGTGHFCSNSAMIY